MYASWGTLFGVVLGAALLGKLLAWIGRKLTGMPVLPSYAVGVAISTLAYLSFSPNWHAEFETRTVANVAGVLCGVVAFLILCVSARVTRR